MIAPRILTIDIETMPGKFYSFGPTGRPVVLNIEHEIEADRVSCYGYKWLHEDKVRFASEWKDGQEGMATTALDLLNTADGVVTYNGDSFDIPWLKRLINEQLRQRPADFISIDLYKANAKHFRYASRKLAYLLRRLELRNKMKHDGFDLWRRVDQGDPLARREMRRYCMTDVSIEELAYLEMLPYLDKHPNYGLYVDDEHPLCKRCGSDHLQKRGFHRTGVSVFQRYQCQSCGTWMKGGKRIGGVDLR
jgi:DNA polymerase elongation subunit (family B)